MGLILREWEILGDVTVRGSIDGPAAIVSGGVIGDVAGGTTLSSGAIKGILAAKADIAFGGTGNIKRSTIIENASGANAAAIDAIFTQGGNPLEFDVGRRRLAGT